MTSGKIMQSTEGAIWSIANSGKQYIDEVNAFLDDHDIKFVHQLSEEDGRMLLEGLRIMEAGEI